MRDARDVRIDSLEIPSVVQLAGKQYGLTENENKSVLNHLIREGNLNLYGLANAVTRTAQDAESYDRATELETTGWEILNVSKKTWGDWNRG